MTRLLAKDHLLYYFGLKEALWPVVLILQFPANAVGKSCRHSVPNADRNAGGGFFVLIADRHPIWNGFEKLPTQKQLVIRRQRRSPALSHVLRNSMFMPKLKNNSLINMDEDVDNHIPKRARPNFLKCDQCRRSKIKCEPKNRAWPAERCRACLKRDLPCSPNVRKYQQGFSVHSEDAASNTLGGSGISLTGSSPLGDEFPSGSLVFTATKHIPFKQIKRHRAVSSSSHVSTALSSGGQSGSSIPRSSVLDENFQLGPANSREKSVPLAYKTSSTICDPSTQEYSLLPSAIKCSRSTKIGGGDEALTGAIESGHDNVVDYLINNTNLVSLDDISGACALRRASLGGNAWIAEVLLKHMFPLHRDAASLHRQAIHQAAERGYFETMKFLVERGADPNVQDLAGSTPLWLAANNGHILVTELLYKSGADVHKKGPNGSQPLHCAARGRHTTVVQYLLSKLSDPNMTDSNGETAVFYAARYGHVDIIRMLTQKNADIHIQSRHGAQALHEAACHGDIEVVRFLVHMGANINHEARCWPQTPLLASIRIRHWTIAKVLLDAGADINYPKGNAPILEVTFSNSVPIARLLLEAGAEINRMYHRAGRPTSPIHQAAFLGHADLLQDLIDHGADVGMRDNEGQTALIMASIFGKSACVEILVKAGADVNMEGAHGNALYQATLCGHYEVSRILLEHTANRDWADADNTTTLFNTVQHGWVDITARLLVLGSAHLNVFNDSRECTPLHLAISKRNVAMVDLLLSYGADLSIATTLKPIDWELTSMDASYYENDNDYSDDEFWNEEIEDIYLHVRTKGHRFEHGTSTVSLAARVGNYEITKRLLNAGASLMTIDGYNNVQPIHEAARAAHEQVFDLLLHLMVDFDCEDRAGRTALWFAAEGGSTEIVSALIDRGARIDVADKRGDTELEQPLHRATWLGHAQVVELLLQGGAHVDAKTKAGMTPLIQAALRGHSETAKILLEYGAALDTTFGPCEDSPLYQNLRPAHREFLFGPGSSSPLHLAAKRGHQAICDLLIRSGADLEAKDMEGNTALLLTARDGHHGVLSHLISCGGDVYAANSQGHSALTLAAKSGNLEAVKALTTAIESHLG